MAHRMLFFVLALCPLAAGTSSPPAKSTSKEFRTLWVDLADAGLNPHSLAFSPDSRLLAADFGAAVRLWDVRTGKPVANFDEGHVRPVTRMAFSRKPGLLATVGEDNAVRLWDVARGRQIRVWQHTNWVRAVAFSPDGKLLASSCFDDTVRVFKVKTGAEIYKLAGHTQLGG